MCIEVLQSISIYIFIAFFCVLPTLFGNTNTVWAGKAGHVLVSVQRMLNVECLMHLCMPILQAEVLNRIHIWLPTESLVDS